MLLADEQGDRFRESFETSTQPPGVSKPTDPALPLRFLATSAEVNLHAVSQNLPQRRSAPILELNMGVRVKCSVQSMPRQKSHKYSTTCFVATFHAVFTLHFLAKKPQPPTVVGQ